LHLAAFRVLLTCHIQLAASAQLAAAAATSSYKAAISNFDLSNAKTQDRWQPIKKYFPVTLAGKPENLDCRLCARVVEIEIENHFQFMWKMFV